MKSNLRIRLGAAGIVVALVLFAYSAISKPVVPSSPLVAARAHVTAQATAVASASASPSPHSMIDRADASCVIARIADVPVRVDDARQLRALLNPPPLGDVALDLALDVAVAHIMQLGYLAPASAKRRLAAYRDVVQTLRSGTSPSPADSLEAVARHLAAAARAANLEPGPCYPSEAPIRAAADQRPVSVPRALQREWSVLRQRNVRSPLFVLEHTFESRPQAAQSISNPRTFKRNLGLVSLDGLELDLARALEGSKTGDTVGPIATDTGTHVLRVRRRIEPASLPEQVQRDWLPSKASTERPRSAQRTRAASGVG